MVYLLFVIGFVFLVYGANWLVDGAASIAKKHRISHVVIGMTIVALGTSAPELVVNLVASFKGTEDVAFGNILGSNISNIFLILGVSALIFPVAVQRNSFRKEIPFAFVGSVLMWIMANNYLVGDYHNPSLHRIDGIVLAVLFLVFMRYAFGIARDSADVAVPEVKSLTPWLAIVMVVGGMAALVVGGRWIVDGAVEIAFLLGMSEAVVSLTVVALGTSLPELATCVAAALKRNADIVIGNVIGSNIFNVFFVLGISAVIKPLPFNRVLNFDVLTGILAVVLLWVFILSSGRRRVLLPWHGGVLVFLYVAYIFLLLFMN